MTQVPEYIHHVDKRLKEESERILYYLDQSTKYNGNANLVVLELYFILQFQETSYQSYWDRTDRKARNQPATERLIERLMISLTYFKPWYIFIIHYKKMILKRHKWFNSNCYKIINQTGLDMMLDQNRLEDLNLLFDLLSRTKDGVKELLVSFAAYIKVRFNLKIANIKFDSSPNCWNN